jgi:NAD+ diphosphatase
MTPQPGNPLATPANQAEEGGTVTRSFSLPLSRAALDRDSASRAVPGFIDDAWQDDTTRVVAIWRGEVLCRTGETLRLRLLTSVEIPRWERLIYLGKTTVDADDGTPAGVTLLGAMLTDDQAREVEPDVTQWVSGRTSGHALGPRDAGLLVEALALSNWHRSHSFSPLTGHPTRSGQAGWVLVDEVSGKEMYPRTDAAIIVLVTDKHDRIVLGSNAMWEAQRYSLLAGFVEPGESLEAAVLREVWEESGLTIANPVYWGSQPWPFPASLMVGFRAELDEEASGELRPDGTEIVDLRWFSRADLQASLGDIALPGPTSIARQMIEDWFGGPLRSHPW